MALPETAFHIPVLSLIRQNEEVSEQIRPQLAQLPINIRTMLCDEKTAAYLRGLGRNYNLSPSKITQLGFIVLKVGIGKLPIPKLSGVVSAELQLSMVDAEKISQEIEHDLIAPIALELNDFLQKRSGTDSSSSDTASLGGSNTLNLKSPTVRK